MTQEELRLEQTRQKRAHWQRWGPYLSERAWGTVREDYSPHGNAWEYLSARSRTLSRISVERRRHCRDLRPSPAHLLCRRHVERPRSDPEGAALRPHRQRRQSRRGREGVLLLPGQHADPLVHEVSLQVPACGVSVCAARRGEPPARTSTIPSSSSWTPAFSPRTATSTSFVEYAKASPEDILVRITVTNHGPEAADDPLLPTVWFRNTWSWG